jgi:hypothetical protein
MLGGTNTIGEHSSQPSGTASKTASGLISPHI